MTDAAAPPRLSIALASAAALAYQILLLRLFSITQFHHTAYLVISLALLGYGASGTLLALRGTRWRVRFDDVYVRLVALAAAAMGLCFGAAQRVMVHPEEMLWAPREALRLTLVYLLLALPFLAVGAAIGLALMCHRPRSVYAWDLVGAGCGSALVVPLLWWLEPAGALRVLALAMVGAALLATALRERRARGRAVVVAAAALVVVTLPRAWIEPRMSPYKGLSQALRIQGAELVERRSSPLALISVVENPVVPLRHAPGLSLAAPSPPADQVGLFLDGDTLTPIVDAGDPLDYLDFVTAAAPYHVRRPSSVLVLGAGGGEGVLRAVEGGASSVVGVEVNPQIIDLVERDYADLSGSLYGRPGVEIVASDVRGFASRDKRVFDLVEVVAAGDYGGGGPALASLSESFLLTVEALGLYLDRVAPAGLLSLTSPVENPPRDTLKLAATAIEVLERRGSDPPRHLAILRSWQTATLLVSRRAITDDDVERLRRFARERFFDLVAFPGMDAAEANRYNRLDRPWLHLGVRSLLGPDRDTFLAGYEFDVRPAFDDRPFFHQFFRWSSLGRILAVRDSGGMSLLEAGYLVLVMTLAQGVALAAILVLVPWWGLRRSARGRRGHAPARRLVVFFAALGLGFLFLEVAYLQKLVLFLHHPVYSAAVVLASFLVFAGLGSAASGLARRRWGERDIPAAALGAAVLAAAALVAVRAVAPVVASSPAVVRVGVAVALIAPMAFAMGMPLPLGMARLRRRAPGLVPWAWGVNGFASVVSPVLATLVAVHLGFGVVVLLGAAAYVVAAAAGSRL